MVEKAFLEPACSMGCWSVSIFLNLLSTNLEKILTIVRLGVIDVTILFFVNNYYPPPCIHWERWDEMYRVYFLGAGAYAATNEEKLLRTNFISRVRQRPTIFIRAKLGGYSLQSYFIFADEDEQTIAQIANSSAVTELGNSSL